MLHIGQCLPKACSNEDIAAVMSNDQALIAVGQTDAALSVYEVRMVPGNLNILKDSKFYAFS